MKTRNFIKTSEDADAVKNEDETKGERRNGDTRKTGIIKKKPIANTILSSKIFSCYEFFSLFLLFHLI